MAVTDLRSSGNTSASEFRIPQVKSRVVKAPIAIGAAVVLVCALVFVLTSLHTDNRRPILVVAKAVPAGHVLQRSDVQIESMSVSSNVHSIPASSLQSVIGRQVAVPLAPNTLLSSTQLGDVSNIDPNQVVVGLSLKSGQFPPSLSAGSRVRVIDTSSGISIADQAVVSTVSRSNNDTSLSTVIELQLGSDNAGTVTTSGAAGHVALVGLPGVTK